jgi:hypothetical protein
MMSNPFDPEDIREIEEAFARVDGEVNGYRVEFILSKEAALDMIKEWELAMLADRTAASMCWSRYGYIIGEIISAVEEFG